MTPPTGTTRPRLSDALTRRYADAPPVPDALSQEQLLKLTFMAERGSVRAFKTDPIDQATLSFLSAVALASPTKSDLQQRDIILIQEPTIKVRLIELMGTQAWVKAAPTMLVFCGNNRRQRLVHRLRGHPFANDHLDAFFNSAVDAGIALSAFVTAAEAIGLGTCPISAIRNHAEAVCELLDLPDYAFPLAGLAVGWPAEAPEISPRLPLSVTLHVDRYEESGLEDALEAYDAARASIQPYAKQRFTEDYGMADPYVWSEDKARQYSKPEREQFGAFVRGKGFKLD